MKFFISSFARKRIVFQNPQFGSNASSAFVILRIDECDCLNVNANSEFHTLISESGINVPRFRIRSVSSIRQILKSLRISSLIKSSKVCPGFLSWWTIFQVCGVTGILFVARSDTVMPRC